MSEPHDGPERRAAAERERRKNMERRSGLDRRRGPGRRRADLRRAAEEGELSGELLEFVMAIDEYKRVNARPFPSYSEIFEIVKYLGYRQVSDKGSHINTPTDGDDSSEGE